MQGLNPVLVVNNFLEELWGILWARLSTVSPPGKVMPTFSPDHSLIGRHLIAIFQMVKDNEVPEDDEQTETTVAYILSTTDRIAHIAHGKPDQITPGMCLEDPFWYMWAMSRIWALEISGRAIGLAEAAKKLGISRGTLHSHFQRGNLVGYFNPDKGYHLFDWTSVQEVVQSKNKKGRPSYGRK